MGQKVNAVAARLTGSTRRFSQNWYSGYFYRNLIEKDISFTSYFTSFFRSFKLPQSKISLAHFPKGTKIFSFFCYPKEFRDGTGKLFGASLGIVPKKNQSPSKRMVSSIENAWMGSKQGKRSSVFQRNGKNSLENPVLLFPNSFELASPLLKEFYLSWAQNTLTSSSQKSTGNLPLSSKESQPPHSWVENAELNYGEHIETLGSASKCCPIDVIQWQTHHEWQSARYFVDEIVYLLERRIAFRSLKNRLFKQLSKNPYIQGFRITWSGRAGGKSKKSQRAKTECLRYGETSLHVFSGKIDYACGTAFTALGSVGIKVWICYRQKISYVTPKTNKI